MYIVEHITINFNNVMKEFAMHVQNEQKDLK